MIRHLTLNTILGSQLLTFSLLLGLSTSQAAERILKFPTDWPHASVKISKMPVLSDRLSGLLVFDFEDQPFGAASGELRIPDDAFVSLVINAYPGYAEFIAELANSDIQGIELKKATLSDSLLEKLEGIPALRKIQLVDCSVEELNHENTNGLPMLQNLYCYFSGDKEAFHQRLIPWVAKCNQLQEA